MNDIEKYIKEHEHMWYGKFKTYLNGKILKIGDGLGYLAEYIGRDGHKLDILEIEGCAKSKFERNKIIYDGIHFPFKDNSYDTSLVYFVLHHTPDPLVVINEMLRVSKRLIIVEESYGGFLSKLDLVYRDIYVNTLAKQPSKIMWNSYFKKGELKQILSQNLKVLHYESTKKRSYWKELIVVERD
mgnify:CR=1 FL=1